MDTKTIGSIFSEGIPNYLISRKIGVSADILQNKITSLYSEYWKNVIIYGILNSLIAAAAIVSYAFSSVNQISVFIISTLLMVLIVRTMILTVQNIQTVIAYRDIVFSFFTLLRRKRSLSKAIKRLIRLQWREKYAGMTNRFTARAHTFFSDLGMVKSAGEIENEIVAGYYSVIQDFLIKNILYKVLAVCVFYGIFLFVLRPYVFSYTLNMGVMEIIAYPFTVVFPAVISIMQDWIQIFL